MKDNNADTLTVKIKSKSEAYELFVPPLWFLISALALNITVAFVYMLNFPVLTELKLMFLRGALPNL